MAFADQLWAAVQRSGLTQPAAADLLGIKPRTLWDWLHGKVEPHRYMQRGALDDLAGRAAGAGRGAVSVSDQSGANSGNDGSERRP